VQVIGTAGHVDHGKSTLVKALTGIDPDRLKEEKEREMTIDLGFAWLTTPGGREASIIDVPGHEDFIKNMLAGVGGIDVALLVVAADEGVMLQTREHLDILDLLGVSSGIVALTKMDLVGDPEWLELVREDLASELAKTSLAGATTIAVSTVTGTGIPDLLAEIDQLLAQARSRPDLGRPRLPIDRAFTISGFGTVVTGTLLDGCLEIGQEVEIQPVGLRSRIRGLQTHRRKTDRATPGSRLAINLVGLSVDDLRRGQVVCLPGTLSGTVLLDARLRLLERAPKPLPHDAAVDFFSGAAQVPARLRILDQKELAPGQTGWVQIRLDQAAALASGDRFIIRRPSPSMTLGGGTVVSAHPPRRYRRFRPEAIRRLEVMAKGDPSQIILQVLDASSPLTVRQLEKHSSLTRDDIESTLMQLADSRGLSFLAESPPAQDAPLDANTLVASVMGWQKLMRRLVSLLEDYHRRQPLRQGMAREELKSKLRLDTRLFNEVIAQALREDRISQTQTLVHLPGHEVAFGADQQRRIDLLSGAIRKQPYTPPSVAQAEEIVGREVLSALIEQGRLVKLTGSVLFDRQTYDQMVARVIEHLEAGSPITVAGVRDMFGTSRKYALALLEHMDEQRITRRVGDERILR